MCELCVQGIIRRAGGFEGGGRERQTKEERDRRKEREKKERKRENRCDVMRIE